MNYLASLKYLRLKPFDTETESGRTQERYRLSALGAISGAASSGFAFLALLVTVPLTLPYLGEERFGVWMTVASLAGMLTFLDLGVGNGFVSFIARLKVTGDNEDFKGAVTRGMILLAIIGLVMGLLLALLNVLWPLQSIIVVKSHQAMEDARISAWVFICIFGCSIPFQGTYRIFNGVQKLWAVNLFRSIGSIVSILAVFVLSKIEAAPYYLLLATYGVQTLIPLALLAYIIRKKWFTLTPHKNRKQANQEYKYLLNIGGLFFLLQIGTMVGWGADALLISSLSGAAAVAQFAIAQRIYQLVSVPVAILSAPLWAAYADARAHGDTIFIVKTLKKSILVSVAVSGTLSSLLYLTSGMLVQFWIGDIAQLSTSLLLAFSIWKVMESIGISFSMLLNGMHIITPQVVSVVLFCLLAFPLKFYFIPKLGAPAAVWSTVTAYSISVFAYYSLLYSRQLHQFFLPGKKSSD